MANRFDPYRNFTFRVAVGAVLAVAGLGLVSRLVKRSGSRQLDPKDYIPKEPPPLPPPIISVGTSTAGRTRARASSRTRGSGGTKKR